MKQPNPETLTAAVLRSLPAEFSDTYAPNTYKAYSRTVERFASFLGSDEADDASVAAFLEAEAQSMVAAGASTADLVQAGRWRDSRTASRCAANELAERGAVARYFKY